jgi:hypothetical protein
MEKRRRRKKVELARARDWLERSESGESPKKIGERDGYDVRTVRRYIELASEEREGKEARAAVVRGAYEEHYKDIVNFAKGLDDEINSEIPISRALRENRMWGALKEHQPKATLWKYLRQWDQTHSDIEKLNKTITKRLENEVSADKRLTNLGVLQRKYAIAGITAAVFFQMRQWARGAQGLNLPEDFHEIPKEKGLVKVEYGSFHMEDQDPKEVSNIKSVISDLERKVTSWSEYNDLQERSKNLSELKDEIRDELTVIILRRIVRERCRYCPL